MEEAEDIAIPLFIEAGSGYTVYEAEASSPRDRTVVQNDTLVFDSTPATSRPSSTLSEGQAGRSASKACTASQARRLPDTRRRRHQAS